MSSFRRVLKRMLKKRIKSYLSFLSFVDAHVPEGRLRKRWGIPIEGEQEGENPAFRAGKGQEFPTCEPRRGQRESKGAKGYEGLIERFKIAMKHQKVRNSLV